MRPEEQWGDELSPRAVSGQKHHGNVLGSSRLGAGITRGTQKQGGHGVHRIKERGRKNQWQVRLRFTTNGNIVRMHERLNTLGKSLTWRAFGISVSASRIGRPVTRR